VAVLPPDEDGVDVLWPSADGVPDEAVCAAEGAALSVGNSSLVDDREDVVADDIDTVSMLDTPPTPLPSPSNPSQITPTPLPPPPGTLTHRRPLPSASCSASQSPPSPGRSTIRTPPPLQVYSFAYHVAVGSTSCTSA